MKQISIGNWEGLSTEDKPTETSVGATLKETDTGVRFITHDGGTSWIVIIDLPVEAGLGQDPIGVNVQNESTEVVPANTRRKIAIVVNDSDTEMWAAIGKDAVVGKGIPLTTKGSVLIVSKSGDIFSTEAINCIHGSSGDKVAAAQEFI